MSLGGGFHACLRGWNGTEEFAKRRTACLHFISHSRIHPTCHLSTIKRFAPSCGEWGHANGGMKCGPEMKGMASYGLTFLINSPFTNEVKQVIPFRVVHSHVPPLIDQRRNAPRSAQRYPAQSMAPETLVQDVRQSGHRGQQHLPPPVHHLCRLSERERKPQKNVNETGHILDISRSKLL